MLIEIHASSFKKLHFKISSGKWPPFCNGLNVLKTIIIGMYWPRFDVYSYGLVGVQRQHLSFWEILNVDSLYVTYA